MRTSTALTSYPSVQPTSTASLPNITAAQITSHWSSRFVEHKRQSMAALAQPNANAAPPTASISYFSYLHSAITASYSYSTSHSRASQSQQFSPNYLPCFQQPPLAIRRKQRFSAQLPHTSWS